MKTKFFHYSLLAIVAISTMLMSACKNEKPDVPPEDDTPLLKIEATEITDASCTIVVTPKSDTISYLGFYVDAAYYDEAFGSDDALLEAYMAQLEEAAVSNKMTLAEFLEAAKALESGRQEFELTGLDASTEYIYAAVCFGKDYQPSSKLFSTKFTTSDIVKQEINFTFDITDLTETTATLTVTADNASGYFYFDIVSEDQLTELGGDPAAMVEIIKQQYAMYGYTGADLFSGLASQGSDSYSYKGLTPGEKYYAYAVGVNSTFTANSQSQQQDFSTVAVPRSDIQITIDTVSVTQIGGSFTFTPSNNDKYVFMAVEKAYATQQGSDQAVMEAIINSLAQSVEEGEDITTYTGTQTIDVKSLMPGTEYVMYAFAYNYIPVSDAFKFNFSTKALVGNPCDMTITATYNGTLDEKTVSASFITDMVQWYFPTMMEKSAYDKMVAAGNVADSLVGQLKEVCNLYAAFFGADPVEIAYMYSVIGNLENEPFSAEGGVEYVLIATAINPDQISAPCEQYFVSEPFSLNDAAATNVARKSMVMRRVDVKAEVERLNNAHTPLVRQPLEKQVTKLYRQMAK